jgi:hypothetical protein
MLSTKDPIWDPKGFLAGTQRDLWKKKFMKINGRGDRIWTCDSYVPKVTARVPRSILNPRVSSSFLRRRGRSLFSLGGRIAAFGSAQKPCAEPCPD